MLQAKVLVLVVAVGVIALAGCQTTGSKQVSSTVLGAAAGGFLGSQVGSGGGQLVGMAVGTLAGALLGRGIGTSLDNADTAIACLSEESAAQPRQSDQTTCWTDPDGNSVRADIERSAEALPCAEHWRSEAQSHPDDAPGNVYGSPDCSWKVVN